MIFSGTTTQNADGTTTFRQDGRVIARGKVMRFNNSDDAWAYIAKAIADDTAKEGDQ